MYVAQREPPYYIWRGLYGDDEVPRWYLDECLASIRAALRAMGVWLPV